MATSSSPRFAKRHYEAIARVLAESYACANDAHSTIARELAGMFASDNPSFNCRRFLAAAGVPVEDRNRV